jgi:disulfide bond formation protein DsbB
MNKISERRYYFLGFIITIIVLGVTYYLQDFDGFIPCPLCILQRITLTLLSILFLIGSIFAFKKIGNFLLSFFASLISLLGIFFSGRQVWLQHFPNKNADCGASLQYLIHVLPFDQVVSKVLQGTAECAQKGWEFLTLSLAEWSLICFVGFFLFCMFRAGFFKKL